MRVREKGVKVVDRMDLTAFSERLLAVVEQMGAANWRDRPSAAELLQLPLFKLSSRMPAWMVGNHKSSKKRN